MRYIGGTWNYKRRTKMHLYLLRANRHFNLKMQEDFNIFGEPCFEIRILKRFKKMWWTDNPVAKRYHILEQERDLIRKSKNLYNILYNGK